MKNLFYLLLISMILFSSCGEDDPVTSGSDEPVDYDCETFFDTGDYSSLCFVGDEGLLVDVDAQTGTTCVVQLGQQPNSVNDYVTISFFESIATISLPGLPSPTEGVFSSIKNDSENTEDVSNLGNSAFTAIDDTSNNNTRVQLYVRYSNLILTFDTVYENATGPHCASDHEELIKLAKIVLENLAG